MLNHLVTRLIPPMLAPSVLMCCGSWSGEPARLHQLDPLGVPVCNQGHLGPMENTGNTLEGARLQSQLYFFSLTPSLPTL